MVSAIDPALRVVGDLGRPGVESEELTGIVPLGIAPRADALGATPNASAAAFRIELSLPASAIDSLPGHALKLAVESERVPGAVVPETAAGFIPAHLHGSTAITLGRAVPDSADADVRKLRFQRGFNHLVSP
ncbi:MAG TPA: hypothetical protein VN605_02470, partial [Thermoanaerobaculia bacterium]|nr:hypothetical protein [Thermoanaerobaculia bacterium]